MNANRGCHLAVTTPVFLFFDRKKYDEIKKYLENYLQRKEKYGSII